MYVNVVRALTRREGLRLAAAGPRHLERKLATLPLVAGLGPLRVLLEPVVLREHVGSELADLRLRAELAEPRVQGGDHARAAFHLIDRRVHLPLVAPDEHQPVPLPRERHGRFEPDAARRAGDQDRRHVTTVA